MSEKTDFSKIHQQAEYGISFLDNALIQIARKDLIVIGAKTGVGKTEMAKIVAKHNAEKGLRVSAFFLEAEENEIEVPKP